MFAAFGFCSISVYAFFIWYFQNHYQVWSRESRYLSNIVLIPGIGILLYSYYRGFRTLKDHPSVGLKLVIGSGLALAVTAVLIPSFYSFDLFAYINYGWQQARYHANPYCLLLAGTEGYQVDKMFTDTWALNPMPYGFAFGHIARILCQLSGGILQNAIVLFKATNFLAWVSLGAVVYIGAIKFNRTRPDVSLYLYLWSPIIMFHSLSGCHNDILMTLPAMAGILCASSAVPIVAALSIPLVVFAALVKYVWAIAIPFLLLFLLRNRAWLASVIGVIMGSSIGVGLGSYYKCRWDEVRWMEFRYNLGTNTNSIPAVIESIGRNFCKTSGGQQVSTDSAAALVAVIYAVKAILFTALLALTAKIFVTALAKKQHYKLQDVVQGCVTIILFMTCALSGKFYPWYIVMFFPAGLWLPESSKLRKLAITLSCTQVLAVTGIGHEHVANFLLLTLIPLLIFAAAIARERKISRTSGA